jgi:NADH:ubiquinone oxidoreductase subunit 5 (subunit L)/multisubunit Na+/H+ antiporter MnhA subunit
MTEENISQEKQIEETKNWDGITILLLVLSGLLLVFSFFAPYLFTRPAISGDMDFTGKGAIGDAVGGLMNPFIALVGVLLTFLAFYMQIKANKIQRELFYKGLQENKRQFDQELNANREQLNDQLAIQTHQFKKSEFESQFYEMLKLHKENVNEVSISRKVRLRQSIKIVQDQYIEIKGRKAFEEILQELEKCYEAAKKTFNNRDKYYWLERSYKVFFFGINSNENGIKRYYFKVDN